MYIICQQTKLNETKGEKNNAIMTTYAEKQDHKNSII